MKIQVIQPEAISLSKTPLMNPMKEPNPAYMASPDCFPEVSSPMTPGKRPDDQSERRKNEKSHHQSDDATPYSPPAGPEFFSAPDRHNIVEEGDHDHYDCPDDENTGGELVA